MPLPRWVLQQLELPPERGYCNRRARKAAGVDFGEDAEFDQAFQLGPGAFDVLRQRFVAQAGLFQSSGDAAKLQVTVA
ncbi:hypothetical protein ACIQCF_36595 [Streptomyces sp. NPDC088353]|uniref:hypothetical protein n=1 Tax=unclassified Streptomyces TaxID=2593676 RepID=UPI0036896DE5